jgi:hypothetical protein
VTLEASVERAGRALACVYSGSQEFEAAVIRARRGHGLGGLVCQLQVALVATAVAALAMLVALFV